MHAAARGEPGILVHSASVLSVDQLLPPLATFGILLPTLWLLVAPQRNVRSPIWPTTESLTHVVRVDTKTHSGYVQGYDANITIARGATKQHLLPQHAEQ